MQSGKWRKQNSQTAIETFAFINQIKNINKTEPSVVPAAVNNFNGRRRGAHTNSEHKALTQLQYYCNTT